MSDNTPDILREFQNLHGSICPEGFQVNFLGVLHRDAFSPAWHGVAHPPTNNEDIFEYASILEAAKNAAGHYTFVEAGAGFGRWSGVAVAAARRLAKSYTLHLIEAEPQHVEWISTHMADNDISTHRYHVHPVLVGATASVTPFTVIAPQEGINPRTWYGQAAMDSSSQHHLKPSEIEYFGRKVRMHPHGWGAIDIETRPFHEILSDVPFIDLIDMDIQGAEADAVAGSLDFLGARVKRLYINTHSTEVEARLREMLSAANWTCTLDYECGKTSPTPYGEIRFEDGAQDWSNPRLATAK